MQKGQRRSEKSAALRAPPAMAIFALSKGSSAASATPDAPNARATRSCTGASPDAPEK